MPTNASPDSLHQGISTRKGGYEVITGVWMSVDKTPRRGGGLKAAPDASGASED